MEKQPNQGESDGMLNKLKRAIGISTLAAAGAVAPAQAQHLDQEALDAKYSVTHTYDYAADMSKTPPTYDEMIATATVNGERIDNDLVNKEEAPQTYDEMIKTTTVDGVKLEDIK